MRDSKYCIFAILFIVIAVSLTIIATNNTYGHVELRMFNKLNNTSYTLPQWRLYRYEIMKLYPFVGQE